MAHFFGSVEGQAGKATRLGSKRSGLRVEAASWQGKVTTNLFEQDGRDMVEVWLQPHHGAGTSRLLFRGPVDGKPENVDAMVEA